MTDRQLKDRAIDFKGSQYVQVKDRIQYLADNFEGKYSIETDYKYFEESKMRVVRAILTWNGCVYYGTAQEIEGQGYINKTSALENAETSAVGRACAMAGIGVIDSIASMDEINKANNRAEKSEPKSKDKSETKTVDDNPNGWFKKACESVNFMSQCLDEDDFIKKIKDKYTVDDIIEGQLREAYKHKMGINDDHFDTPFG